MNRLGLLILLVFVFWMSAAFAAEPKEIAQEFLEAAFSDSIEETAHLFLPEEQARMHASIIPLLKSAVAQDEPEVLELALGKGATLESISSLSDLEATRAFLRVYSMAMKESRGLDDPTAVLTIPDSTWTIETIGVLEETPNLIHVLCRYTFNLGPEPLPTYTVISLSPSGDGYLMRLTSELEKAIQAFAFTDAETR